MDADYSASIDGASGGSTDGGRSGSELQPKTGSKQKFNIRWLVVTSIVWFLGGFISSGCYALAEAGAGDDRAAQNEAIGSMAALLAVISLTLVGVAQFARAASHGGGACSKLIDGLAKVVSTFGWALGATGAAMLHYDGTDALEWGMGFLAIALVFMPVVPLLGVILWRQFVVRKP